MRVDQSRCAHIARTDAARIRGIRGFVPDDARVSGRSDLRFRTVADLIACERQARQDTANAVGCNHPPGFKSPILRLRAGPWVSPSGPVPGDIALC
jgi:hypothetical protein